MFFLNLTSLQHTDHLGNVVAVCSDRHFQTNDDTEIDCRFSADYYPFGLLVPTRYYPDIPYRYGFNGQEKEDEVYGEGTLLGFEYRQYDSRIGRFWSVDPLSEEYPGWTPYHFCSDNPINFIDPDGLDDYKINKQGRIISQTKNAERDAIFIVDKKGNTIEGKELYFKYGTIQNFQSQYSTEEERTFDWYQIRGDEQGVQFFEFMAKNTSVEWTQMQIGEKGDNGLNIISTSHEKNTERTSRFLLNNKYKFNYFIRSHIHSHPTNTLYPSNSNEKNVGDIEFAKTLSKIANTHGYPAPKFKIFAPDKNKYIYYHRYSELSDFKEYKELRIGAFTFPEVIIKFK